MSNLKTSQRKGFFVNSAIEGILKNYPSIDAKDIVLFAPVYYPIADIEIDFEEASFEDFETVQITVLKLINLGHKSVKTISELMGLTPLYIEKVINLLLGFCHIDENLNVTQLGKESLSQGKKITTVRAAQRFQLDPLGLNLIRLDKTVNGKSIINKDEISNGVLILDFPDSISKEIIVDKLQSENFRAIMASKNKILNVNIAQVHSVKCLAIRYVQAYVLLLKDQEPIIFSEREDFTKKRKQRFSWLPFAAISSSTIKLLDIEDLTIYPRNYSEQIISSINLLINESQTEKTSESKHTAIDELINNEELGLVAEYININYNSGLIGITSKKAFSKTNFKTVHLLKLLADNGICISTRNNLRGSVIKLFVTDKEILSSFQKLNRILINQGSDDIETNIRIFIKKIEKSENLIENGNIIDIINQFKL